MATSEKISSQPLPIPPHLLQSARTLRKNQTDAEHLLWYLLRRRQLAGFHFRRQHPFLGFILDFYCAKAKLVIEVDGGQHAIDLAYDARRTVCLAKHDIKVVRVWNGEVFQNLEGVLAMIYKEAVERVEERRDGAPPP